MRFARSNLVPPALLMTSTNKVYGGLEDLALGHRLVGGHQLGEVLRTGPELLLELTGRPVEDPAEVAVEVRRVGDAVIAAAERELAAAGI